MTSAAQSENPSSKLLSESWATLSASDAHSEDGTRSEQTDLASLIDQTSTDDVASLEDQDRYSNSEMGGNDEDHVDVVDDEDDGEDDEETDGDNSSDDEDNMGEQPYMGQESVSESQELPALYHQFGGAIDDSGLTAKMGFHQSTESIEFAEPAMWPEVKQVELKHTIQVFNAAEAARLKEELPCNPEHSILTAKVQQTVTKQGLDIDQPFRVLYIGDPDYRNIILDKIGDVLVSNSRSSFDSTSTESSRYHVIPTSFGAGAVPNFAELLPIHLQLIVDECLEASADPKSGKPSTMSLKFKNRPSCTSYWAGSEYRVSSASDWTLPNVAIFFISSKDNASALETQHIARTFMGRHRVPTMFISEKPLWPVSGNWGSLNSHSLHVCLESCDAQTGETAVVRRYPIDLQTFESITPGQLNRNLASLASISPKQSPSATPEAPRSSTRKSFESFVDIGRYIKHILPFVNSSRAQELTPILRLLALTAVFVIASSLGYTAVNAVVIFLSRLFAQPGVPERAHSNPSSVIPVDDFGQSSLSVRQQSVGEIRLARNQAEDRSHLEELMGMALSTPAPQGEPSDTFELQVIGDCHAVLKPPRWFSTMKKQPKFTVDVTRYESSLSYELSKLFEGVYALRLDREDAYGYVNVTISTLSKPSFQQTAQMDFGSPWLKIANWKRAASTVPSQLVKDLAIAQTSLSRTYDRLTTDLQVVIGDVVKRSHFLRQEADALRHDSAQLSSNAKNTVLSRSMELSEVVKRTAIQPFWAACSAFQERGVKINTEAKDLVSNTWNRASEISAPSVDLGAMVDRIRRIPKHESLSKAQQRARRLMRCKKFHRSGCSKMQGRQRCQR